MFPLHEPVSGVIRRELEAYDDLTAALLARRGVTTQKDAERFLHPSYEEHLHDPLLMHDMERAARRLGDAIINGERIAVWSDYDCDGIPGAVLLHDFLKKVDAQFENYIPHRHLEGYGMNIGGVEKLAERGATLIVTVDSGITDSEPIKRANELNLDVIVTDHHLPGAELPDAYAILNPNARADEPYPFKSLCGSAVAWKLVCATLAVEPRIRARAGEGWEKWLLDMVGLATIADMVPLTGENRVLAHYGLAVMRKSPRIGLQKLVRGMRIFQRGLTEDDVAFMVAPRVNAASRMGSARDAFTLFTTPSESAADLLAKQLEKANRARKAEAGTITRAVHTRIKARSAVPRVIALGDPEWRPALLGLVANTIAEEYERPVFLWGREGNMSLKGSVRSGNGVHILELMKNAPNTFAEFGGHAGAGGFTVLDSEIYFLEERLNTAYEVLIETAKVGGALRERADAVITPDEITPALLAKIERFAPFGVDNPKPVFLLREVGIQQVSRFGKGEEHVKIRLGGTEGEGPYVDSVVFFAKGALAREIDTVEAGRRVNVLGHIERDTFSRGNLIRLRLVDIRVI